MRTAAVLVLALGCAGSSRPAVTPMLSELPADAGKRDAILDSANAGPGPELKASRAKMTSKERRAETTAATAAAILGTLFSKTQNVTIGGGGTFEESPSKPQPGRTAPFEDAPAPPAPAQETDKPGDLVPWIKVKK